MSELFDDECQTIFKTLRKLSLSETKNIKRNFCLTPPLPPSPTLSEAAATDDLAIYKAEELEWLISTLPKRIASEEDHRAKPPIPALDDPRYIEELEAALVYRKWCELPGLDMNESNNRTRFRLAYYRLAFHPHPLTWKDMKEEDIIWSMYDWGERLRQGAEENGKFTEYSIRNQALLKQVPSDIGLGFDYVFQSSGRVEKVTSQSDFCQGKLKSYDGKGREIKEQAHIVRYLGDYKFFRKQAQDANEYIYRTSKRFHDGTNKGPKWMVNQNRREKLANANAYKANAITHLQIAHYKTPDFMPDHLKTVEDADVAIPFPDRKYARLRKPSPRVIPLGTQEAIYSLFQGRPISENIGAPGRPNARVRSRTDPYIKPTILHFVSSNPKFSTSSQSKSCFKRARRKLHYAQIRKTKTERLVEKQSPSIMRDPVSEMSKLHWVLDGEGMFRDFRFIDGGGYMDIEDSRWLEMEPVGVVAVKSIRGGRRFSLD